MSDRQHLRDLTPSTDENAQQWKVVGLELAHRCTFCGDAAELSAALTTPRQQASVCNSCIRRDDHDAVCGGEASANGPAGARYERGLRTRSSSFAIMPDGTTATPPNCAPRS